METEKKSLVTGSNSRPNNMDAMNPMFIDPTKIITIENAEETGLSKREIRRLQMEDEV